MASMSDRFRDAIEARDWHGAADALSYHLPTLPAGEREARTNEIAAWLYDYGVHWTDTVEGMVVAWEMREREVG